MTSKFRFPTVKGETSWYNGAVSFGTILEISLIDPDHVRGTREYSEVFGYVREKVSWLAKFNMAEENDRKGLLDGREAYTRPYTPPNEYDEAPFHEIGKSPKEVSYLL